jgi:hypothetical protein
MEMASGFATCPLEEDKITPWHDVYGPLWGGTSAGGEEERKGVKKTEVCCIDTYVDSVIKPTKHCLIKEGREKEGTEIQWRR